MIFTTEGLFEVAIFIPATKMLSTRFTECHIKNILNNIKNELTPS